jgi:hypothetical protein
MEESEGINVFLRQTASVIPKEYDPVENSPKEKDGIHSLLWTVPEIRKKKARKSLKKP